MTDRLRLGLLVALLLVAAAAGWRYLRDPVAPVAPSPPVAATAAPALEADGLPSAPAKPARRAPLPPKDAPLSTIAASLDAMARDGNSQAACRLAVELLRCNHIELLTAELAKQDNQSSLELYLEAEGDLDGADRSALHEIKLITQLEQCRLLPKTLRDQTWERLRAAALAGEPEAMIRYANSAQIGMGVGHGFLHHPGFDDWRREAPAMLQRLFRSGDRDAAILLMLTSMGDMDPLSGVVDSDPQTFLALRLLQWRMRIDAPEPPPMPRHSAIEIEQAMRQAEAWHRDYFGNRLYPRRTDYGKLAPLSMADDSPSAPCQ